MWFILEHPPKKFVYSAIIEGLGPFILGGGLRASFGVYGTA